jgi:AmmeMemoRadiSam system protein B/AmmeMemoRadiSam system protein A
MERSIIKLTFIIILFVVANCNSQNKAGDKKLINRKPAVAGQFYSSDPEELKSDLRSMFAKASPKTCSNVNAIISPHAGYEYSGIVAASAFNQIDADKEYSDIFVIASSHRASFSGASIYSVGNFETPLGTVEVDTAMAEKLIKENKIFISSTDAHRYEHSIEVQLPFLQYIMKKKFRIVPILIGGQSASECHEIANALKTYFSKDNLFIISSDFSHYPDYKDAVKVDRSTAAAIQSNNPVKLISELNSREWNSVPNLATNLCGWTSVLSLLYITENIPDITVTPVLYQNSGDATGDKSRVVGYFAIAFSVKSQGAEKQSSVFQLNDNDKKELLSIARKAVEQYVKKESRPFIETSRLSGVVKRPCGAFVTLTKHGELRGCIGRFDPDQPLYNVVQDMAIAAATEDYRFKRVEPEELQDISIEISVLSPMKKIKSIDEIEMGRHGIYIKKGLRSGTFLPQVAKDTHWTKEEFLGHCAKDKAGMDWDGWKDAEIFTYEALVFSEKDLK